MTDLHTHILPGMDDGAKTPEESLQMLRMERDQGVDTVVLTPHFYRDRERPEQFLARRRASAEALRDALMALPEEEIRTMPRLILGAEVAWVPNLPDMPELSRMCMGRSKYLLLELPFSAWSDPLFRQLRELMDRTGVTPVIAHVERYLSHQKPERVRELLDLDVLVQVSAAPLLHPLRRGKVLGLLRERQAQFVASDCHDTVSRPPDLGPAAEVLARKLGEKQWKEHIRWADDLAAESLSSSGT